MAETNFAIVAGCAFGGALGFVGGLVSRAVIYDPNFTPKKVKLNKVSVQKHNGAEETESLIPAQSSLR